MLKFIFGLAAVLALSSSVQAEPIPRIDKSRAVYINGPIAKGNLLPLGDKLLEYADQDRTKPVNIIINSPGGDITTGYLFINYLEQVKARGVKVHCYVKHLAASMAFQILIRCDKRYALENSLLLWHPAKVFMMGSMTSEEAAAVAESLLVVNLRIVEDLVANMTGASRADVVKHFYRETLHFAADLDALTNGKFLTVGRAIPGLLDFAPGTVMTSSFEGRFVRQVGRIYYVYEGGL